MNLLFFILIAACLQAATATIVRWIQAKSSDKYASVVANYTIALLIAGVYWGLSTLAESRLNQERLKSLVYEEKQLS